MKHSLLLYLAIPAFVLTLVSCSKDSPDYGDEVIIEWNRWGKCSGIRLAKF